jgi:hypothetical protein
MLVNGDTVVIKITIEPRWAAVTHHGEIELTERELAAYKTAEERDAYIETQVDAYVAEEVQYGWSRDAVGEAGRG